MYVLSCASVAWAIRLYVPLSSGGVASSARARAPAKTPPKVGERLRTELVQVLAEPAVQEKLRAQYMEPVANTPAQFRSMVNDEVARWKPVIEKNSITLD